MKSILLHVCCAPCLTATVIELQKEYQVTLFFSNSNISPAAEYQKRLAEVEKLAKMHQIDLIEDQYDHQDWLAAVAGFEDEAEKGLRCEQCFIYNLGRAAQVASAKSFDYFTTTLTISPHKSAKTIFAIGDSLSGFLARDFKKNDGFKKSIELSKKYDLYRQKYCGCEFSIR